MVRSLKQLISSSALFQPIRTRRVPRAHARELEEWELAGRPLPPPHLFKQQTLRGYARQYDLSVLVETGTFYGDMVEAMRGEFDRVYSVELSPRLFSRAARRFRKTGNVTIIHGDSGVELGAIVGELNRPALFWLDGHYSGGETAKGVEETPIYAELRHILGAPVDGHVIVIDDARAFGTDPAYPTLAELRAFVGSMRPNLEIVVQDDSIRVTPAR